MLNATGVNPPESQISWKGAFTEAISRTPVILNLNNHASIPVE